MTNFETEVKKRIAYLIRHRKTLDKKGEAYLIVTFRINEARLILRMYNKYLEQVRRL